MDPAGAVHELDEQTVDPAAAAWAQAERWRAARRQAGWRRLLFPGIFLVYLGQTVGGVGRHASGAEAVTGYVLVGLFVLVYWAALPAAWTSVRWRYWGIVALITIYVAETAIAHQDAFVMAIFVSVLSIALLGNRAVPIVVALTVSAVFLPLLVPGWHTGVNWAAAFAIPLTSFAMYGFFGVMRSNRELAEARTEVARLAAENERARIARDLHDLLGHSLTTITVKAGLAHRLADHDPERAIAEIAEVEVLSRRALADVRAAIDGYREVTLAGEIASGREVLRAAGVTATVPRAVDIVEPEHQELFGWVVREGITNVVRHARALTCSVTLGPTWVEIVDDGTGAVPSSDGAASGNGLTGLRERAAAAGGRVAVGPTTGGGWRLRVDLAP
jgi:two-component system sensor histidine kinase DesK